MKKTIGLLVVALLALASSGASAATITIGGCEGCFGLSYTLTVLPPTSGTEYAATLQITGVFSGSIHARYISSVDFKVSSDVMPPITLTSAPGVLADWTTTQTGIQNGGCESSGAGFVCSQDAPTVSAASLNYNDGLRSFDPINHTWAWTFNLPDGVSLFAELDGAHIGAKFNNADGTLSGQIMSESFSVPEPASMLLLGTGLLGSGLFARRRKK